MFWFVRGTSELKEAPLLLLLLLAAQNRNTAKERDKPLANMEAGSLDTPALLPDSVVLGIESLTTPRGALHSLDQMSSSQGP